MAEKVTIWGNPKLSTVYFFEQDFDPRFMGVGWREVAQVIPTEETSWRFISDTMHPHGEHALYVNGEYLTATGIVNTALGLAIAAPGMLTWIATPSEILEEARNGRGQGDQGNPGDHGGGCSPVLHG